MTSDVLIKVDGVSKKFCRSLKRSLWYGLQDMGSELLGRQGLDEVLAVGDAAFRHKCYHRLNRLMSSAAVILVSHSMDCIAQTSTAVAMMRRGEAQVFRDSTEGIAAYNEENSGSGMQWADGGRVEAVYPPMKEAVVRILTPEVPYGGRFAVEEELACDAPVPDAVFSFTAVNLSEQTVMAWHTSRRREPVSGRPWSSSAPLPRRSAASARWHLPLEF